MSNLWWIATLPRLGNCCDATPPFLYAFGLNRGEIHERWFASTIEAAYDTYTDDEVLAYVIGGYECFSLKQTVAECGVVLFGSAA